MFGHERGSFTGAVSMKKGLFEVAHRGSLFLDEVSEAPAALQAKLLRVLETRTIKRIGGIAAIHTDFRVLAATNRNLSQEVEEGRFRSDLLYRLNVYTISIAPLRERRGDIPPIVDYYIHRFNKAYRKSITGVTDDALVAMANYSWPGNVRELVNVVERAVITCNEAHIDCRHLPWKEGGYQEEAGSLNLKKNEKHFIEQALALANGHRTKAARLLGIARKTLQEKIVRYGIDIDAYFKRPFWGIQWVLLGLMVVVGAMPVSAAARKAGKGGAHALSPVVVSATRWETSASEAAANIALVTREEIEALPENTVAEALRYQTGLFLEISGGPGAQATASIQGADARHTAVYVDGVPISMLGNPIANLNNISVSAVERIEVYKGAASAAWGSAMGGVINIITREPEADRRISGDVRAGYGDFSTLKTSASISGGNDRFGGLITLTHNENDGFISHSDYEQQAVYFKAHADIGAASRLQFVFSDSNIDYADPLPTLPSIYDDISEERVYQQLHFETAPTDNLDMVLEAYHHEFDLLVEDVLIDGTGRFTFTDTREKRWGGSMRVASRLATAHTLGAGFDGDWGSYDVSGDPNSYDAGNWAFYANDSLSFGSFSFQIGLRYDHNRDFGSQTSPSVGVVYRFPRYDALVRFQVARGFSAPPGYFLHAPPPYGNSDLKSEKPSITRPALRCARLNGCV